MGLSHTANLNISEICLISKPILIWHILNMNLSICSVMLLLSVVLKDPTTRGQLSDVGQEKKVTKAWRSCLGQNIPAPKVGCWKQTLVI